MSGELQEHDAMPPLKKAKGVTELQNEMILNAWGETALHDSAARELLADHENLAFLHSVMGDIGLDEWKSPWQVRAFYLINAN